MTARSATATPTTAHNFEFVGATRRRRSILRRSARAGPGDATITRPAQPRGNRRGAEAAHAQRTGSSGSTARSASSSIGRSPRNTMASPSWAAGALVKPARCPPTRSSSLRAWPHRMRVNDPARSDRRPRTSRSTATPARTRPAARDLCRQAAAAEMGEAERMFRYEVAHDGRPRAVPQGLRPSHVIDLIDFRWRIPGERDRAEQRNVDDTPALAPHRVVAHRTDTTG